jgi:formyl-CoA transferase
VQAADGKWFILGVGSDNTWRKFCEVAGLQGLSDDPRFVTNARRVEHYDDLMPPVRQAILTHTAEEWMEILRRADVPVGKINSVSEALGDPHLAARNFIVQLAHPTLGAVQSLATPIHMSQTPLCYEQHPPMLGEHSTDILRELGYSAEQAETLRANGVI